MHKYAQVLEMSLNQQQSLADTVVAYINKI